MASSSRTRWSSRTALSHIVARSCLSARERPSVPGVFTGRLWELYDASGPLEVISTCYDMREHELRAAVASEEQQRSIAA